LLKDNLLSDGVPMGFGMALAQNPQALERFSMLSEEQQRRVLDGTHAVDSKEAMRAYVDKLAHGTLL